MREERPDLVVVDVREPFEWDEGHIDGRAPPAHGRGRSAPEGAGAGGSPEGGPLRGRLALELVISALSRAGLTGWYNVSGGMTAWQKAGYSTVKPAGQGGA